MVISTSSGKHCHVVVEVEWDGVSAICHRGAELKLSTHFDFRKYLIFSPRYINFCENHAYCQIYPEHPVYVQGVWIKSLPEKS